MRHPLYIERTGSFYLDGSGEGRQPELKSQVRKECQGRYRRIDRFTQLALLGAVRCAAGLPLAENTLLYLASGKGPAGNNIDMQRAIVARREAPMPVQFINAVSNSVSFYIMQELALSGQNLLVSRELHALEAALSLASLDLDADRSSSALVGMVDEITHPLGDQWARLGVPYGTPLGEGSHWFLCNANRPAGAIGVIHENRILVGLPELVRWLSESRLSCQFFFAQGIHEEARLACFRAVAANRGEWMGNESLWDGLTGGAMAEFLRRGNGQWLLTLGCDNTERFHVMLLEKYQVQ